MHNIFNGGEVKVSENYSKNITDFTSAYSEQIKKLAEITRPIVDNINKAILPLQEAAQSIRRSMVLSTKSIQPLIDINKKIAASMQPLIDAIKEASSNPDSHLSWFDYYKVLSKCYWVYPFGVTTEEFKKLTSKEISEKQFDEYMDKHFNVDIINDLKAETISLLDEKHKEIYIQSIDSLLCGRYALCNLGFISIIDDLTSFYLINKGFPGRYGIFEPIVDDIKEIDLADFTTKHYTLMMVNENIKTLYKSYDFNSEVKIGNHKDINRQTSMHGKYFSNSRISSLMLINTIYYLIVVNQYFAKYKSTICWNKHEKKFELSSSK